jgi:hypothetical protein
MRCPRKKDCQDKAWLPGHTLDMVTSMTALFAPFTPSNHLQQSNDGGFGTVPRMIPFETIRNYATVLALNGVQSRKGMADMRTSSSGTTTGGLDEKIRFRERSTSEYQLLPGTRRDGGQRHIDKCKW